MAEKELRHFEKIYLDPDQYAVFGDNVKWKEVSRVEINHT